MSNPGKKLLQASLVIFAIAVIVLVIGYFTYRTLNKISPDSTVQVFLKEASIGSDGRFVVPVVVKNQGDYGFFDMQITVLIQGNGGIIEKTTFTVDRLPPRGEYSTQIAFLRNPKEGKIFSNIEKYQHVIPDNHQD